MSAYLDDVLKAGRRILTDTKTPKLIVKKEKATVGSPTETDPHKIFIRRTIQEKPKKAIVVEEIKRFITSAEALL